MRCGLLGYPLGHSYSPQLHAMLGSYAYSLFEVPPERLDAFLTGDSFDGLNVTIPYKKAVLPYCASLSPEAAAIGSVNTVVRLADGSLFGDNTDCVGFRILLARSGVSVSGKKAVVLGSGGASLAVRHALRLEGADPIITVSRTGDDNYGNLSRHADAAILVNATPVGMYPACGAVPLSLRHFPRLTAVFDLIYNPARTELMLEAERLGIPAFGGLAMLAAQACGSAADFLGTEPDFSAVDRLCAALRRQTENLVLIGMPGCGKSTVGKALAEALGRPFFDSDAELERKIGVSIPDFFALHGENAFRELEADVLRALGARSGCVIATGGGCVLREENYASLHRNGRLILLERPTEALAVEGRPLSQGRSPEALLRERAPYYARFADLTIPNRTAVSDAVRLILEAIP